MNALGLTTDQLAERRKRLHAGDAAMLMNGEWRELWRRKTGRAEEADLSGEFRVQLGSYTEPMNLAWTMWQTKRSVTYYSGNPLMRQIWHELTGCDPIIEELIISPDYPMFACNLDATSTTPQDYPCVLDAKHVGSADDAMVGRYTAAGTHQATVCGFDWWGLSVIVGNKWVEPIYQEVDPLYQAEMIAKAHQFWRYVERDEEPEDRVVVEPPKPKPKLRQLIVPTEGDVFDAMCREENWLPGCIEEMRAFAGTKAAADRHAIARKEIAALVPEDVGVLSYGLVRYKRDGRGVTLSLEKIDA